MAIFYIDELVKVWKRTKVEIPDDVTEDTLVDKLLENNGAAGLLNDSETEDWWQSEEYLVETEEGDALQTELFDEYFNQVN